MAVCDPATTISSADLSDLKKDITTIDVVVESSLDTTVTKDGKTINTLSGQLKLLGFIPPLVYTTGIAFTVTDTTKTVVEAGVVYFPDPSELPFTTTGTFIGGDDAKFFVVQGLTNQSPELIIRPQPNGYTTDITADTTSPQVFEADFFDSNEASSSGAKWISDGTTGGTPGPDLNNGRWINANGDGYLYQTFKGCVSLSAFGGIPDWDGTTGTDNSAALLSATTFNSHIYYEGQFLLGSSVVIVKDHVAFMSNDPNTSFLVYNGTGIGLDIKANINLLQQGRIHFHDFYLRNTTNSPTHGTDFPSYIGQGLKITDFHSGDCGNPEVEGFGIGIELLSCFLNTFTGLTTTICLQGLLLSGASNGNTFEGGAHLLSSYDLRAATNNTLIGVDVEPGSTTSFTGDGNKFINCRLERVSLTVPVNPWLSVGSDNIIDTLGLEANGSSLQPTDSFMVNITGTGNRLTTKTPYVHQQGFFFSFGADDNILEIEAEWKDGVNTGNPSSFQAAKDWVVDYGFNNTLIIKTNGNESKTVGFHTQEAGGTIVNSVTSDVGNWTLANVTVAESTVPGPLNAPLSDLSVREITLTATTGNISNGVIATGNGAQVYSGEIWVQFPASGGVTSAQLRQVTNTGGTKLQDLKKNQWQRIYHVGLPLNTVPVGLQLLLEGAIGEKILVALPRAGAGYSSAFAPYGSTAISTEGSGVSGDYQTVWSASGTNPTLGNGTLTANYYKIEKMNFVDINLTIGSTTVPGTGTEWFFTLPQIAKKAARGQAFYFDLSAVNAWVGVVSVNAGNNLVEIYADNFGTSRFGPSNPVTPATGDTLKFSISFQEA